MRLLNGGVGDPWNVMSLSDSAIGESLDAGHVVCTFTRTMGARHIGHSFSWAVHTEQNPLDTLKQLSLFYCDKKTPKLGRL